MIRHVLLICLVMGLAGCASKAVDIQRYQLPSTSLATLPDVSAPLMILETVELGELLHQHGIVMQTDDITLHAARRHVWASDLDQQLTLGLQRRLQQHLPSHLILLNSQSTQTGKAPKIRLKLDTFQGHYEGYALTEGQWQLVTAEGELQANSTLEFRTELSEDGYGALVRALGKNLDQMAEQIAGQVQKNL